MPQRAIETGCVDLKVRTDRRAVHAPKPAVAYAGTGPSTALSSTFGDGQPPMKIQIFCTYVSEAGADGRAPRQCATRDVR